MWGIAPSKINCGFSAVTSCLISFHPQSLSPKQVARRATAPCGAMSLVVQRLLLFCQAGCKQSEAGHWHLEKAEVLSLANWAKDVLSL